LKAGRLTSVQFLYTTSADGGVFSGDKMLVKAEGGHIFHLSNGRELSQRPNPTIPDGSYMMSDRGIIRVADAVPELKSNFKSQHVAALAACGFEFDEDPAL